MKPEPMFFRPRLAFCAGDGLYESLAPLSEARRKEELMFLLRLGHAVWSGRFSVAMLNNGAEINAVKELLGHSSLASTEVYTHVTFEELKKVYHNAHPRAKN